MKIRTPVCFSLQVSVNQEDLRERIVHGMN